MKLRGGGVKPFDPSNPGATMVVDLTPKDVFKDAKTAAKTIESIINKAAAKKDEPDVPRTYKVEVFEFVETKTFELLRGPLAGEDSKRVEWQVIKNIETNKNYYLFDKSTNSDSFIPFKDMRAIVKGETENAFFIVSKIDKDYGVESKNNIHDAFPLLKLGSKDQGDILLIYNTFEDGWKDYSTKNDNFLTKVTLNMKDQNNFQEGKGAKPICDLISYYSEENKKPILFSDFQPRSPQNIAQFFGYEIPKNYAPGQGVEKTKA